MFDLTSVIKSIQDVMRQDAGINGDAQRIEQMVWLLFLKVFDALEEELELTRDDYKSPSRSNCAGGRGLLTPEGITGDALLDFVNNTLFPKLKALPADSVRNPRGWVVRGVFEDANNFMKSGSYCGR
jgi:type I restriction enzyme M protein